MDRQDSIKTINVAIIGVGTVGRSVIEILQQNEEIILARTGVRIKAKLGIARRIDNKDINIPLSTDIDDALLNPDIDMVVELMGGVDMAYKVALKALENNKSLVTANKAMLAYHRHELEKKRGDIPIGFEASVCGGIPIIRILRDGLCANKILSIRGLMNGTSNYILSKMSNGDSFEVALKDAQMLGYAEADPSLDINGSDSAHKLLILASLAYGIHVDMEDIAIEGLEGLEVADMVFARENDYVIKLLGIASLLDSEELLLRVGLYMIPKDSMLAKVDGAMNAISVIGDSVGESMYYGAGAGGRQTASSVISDIMDIARSKTSPMLGYVEDSKRNIKLVSKDRILSKYYLRLEVLDKEGVLSVIANTLAKHRISIESLVQKNTKTNTATLQLSTHTSTEVQMQEAIMDLSTLKEVIKKPFMIRIEEV